MLALLGRAPALAKPPRAATVRAMGTIDTAAGRIGVIDNGTEAGEPILFLHGVGSDKSVWRPQLNHYRGQRAAFAMDYPGYGDSALQPGATRDDFARAALALLDTLGHDQAHICGLSLGGVVAIAMHALAPERCASLVLADTFAVHHDGQGIYDRSIAASTDLRALAEARVDALMAQPVDPALRTDQIAALIGVPEPGTVALVAAGILILALRRRFA